MKYLFQITMATIIFYSTRCDNVCGEIGILYSGTCSYCYLAYRQGPCPPEHYLVLPPGETKSRCEKNPCLVDGLVPFQGGCHPIGKVGPPCQPYSYRLSVSKNGFDLKCTDQGFFIKKTNLTTPESCPANSYINPADSNDLTNIFCQCKPFYLYHPESNSCHLAYRQGSCPDGHYLILLPEKTVATCKENTCLEDGLVPFQGKCHSLGKSGPACPQFYYLTFDKFNFELQCAPYIPVGPVGYSAITTNIRVKTVDGQEVELV